ncbi:MAG: adenylate/guanylate cyclase domain-containing protein [Chloroflexi bacterium]|nr:MAG: adenylate/guanylate cyclase domain-containing protein [Chloroflexota bacterium]
MTLGRPLAVVLLALLPTALLAWLLADPARNGPFNIPLEHFVITSNVSIVAAVVAFLVARSALQAGHYPTLLVALGFGCMAGLFAVHGLSTPGVLLRGDRAPDAALVTGVSGQLALATAALFLAVRYTRLAGWLARRVRPSALVAVVVLAILAYATVALAAPGRIAQIARVLLVLTGSSPGYDPGSYGYGYGGADVTGGAGWLPYVGVAFVVVLYLVAAFAQGRDFLRTQLPLQGALAVAYVFLAQAQISQFLGPTWTPAWWEYHGLMLVAAVLALGALFIELDRRRGLERFLPPTVVERVISGDPLRLEGERQTVTILFADLRGSTALAETLAPEQIVAVLNAYLRVMAKCVLDTGGILDKFLGDGLMAIFGALGDPTNGAAAAARAALAIRDRVGRLNEERAARGDPVVRFGVGMHTGDVVLGAVGLPERSDYTAIGDTVNTASRMETLTKEFKVDAVLSGETASRLDGDGIELRPLGAATVRGKAQAIEVFTLR